MTEIDLGKLQEWIGHLSYRAQRADEGGRLHTGDALFYSAILEQFKAMADALEVLDRRTKSLEERMDGAVLNHADDMRRVEARISEPASGLTPIERACRVIHGPEVKHGAPDGHRSTCSAETSDAAMLAWLAKRVGWSHGIYDPGRYFGYVLHGGGQQEFFDTARDALAWLVCELGGQP